jgi:hypothetical protein
MNTFGTLISPSKKAESVIQVFGSKPINTSEPANVKCKKVLFVDSMISIVYPILKYLDFGVVHVSLDHKIVSEKRYQSKLDPLAHEVSISGQTNNHRFFFKI